MIDPPGSAGSGRSFSSMRPGSSGRDGLNAYASSGLSRSASADVNRAAERDRDREREREREAEKAGSGLVLPPLLGVITKHDYAGERERERDRDSYPIFPSSTITDREDLDRMRDREETLPRYTSKPAATGRGTPSSTPAPASTHTPLTASGSASRYEMTGSQSPVSASTPTAAAGTPGGSSVLTGGPHKMGLGHLVD